MEFLKHINKNDHTIKLKKDKQPFFSLIYSLKSVKIETLKIYIKITLVNDFIRSSRFLIRISILLD